MKKASNKKALLKIVSLTLVFILVIFAIIFFSYQKVIKVLYPQKQTTLIEKYALEYGVDEALVYAVVNTESGFDPQAKSNAGALGLTQITPETFHWLQTKTGEDLEDKDLLDAETSIKYGCLFLSMLVNEFGDTETAVAAYHAGRGSVNKWLQSKEYSQDGRALDKIPSKDTSYYVHKVTKAIKIYKNLYNI